jgi:hypothetical protein
MAPWKHGLGKGRGRGRNFYYALAEEAATKENHGNCYAKKLMDEAPKYGLSDMEIASLNGNLFGAGSDTSSSTLITFVLACCAFPEVLPRAQEELDRVVGSYRSPSLDDDLPYIRAFVKEVFRWRSVAIIGGQPHANIQDDWYNVSDERTGDGKTGGHRYIRNRMRICIGETPSLSLQHPTHLCFSTLCKIKLIVFHCSSIIANMSLLIVSLLICLLTLGLVYPQEHVGPRQRMGHPPQPEGFPRTRPLRS